jgi:hypothetical protein
MSEWLTDSLPTKSGYYLTVHIRNNETYMKAFWYSVEQKKWSFRYEPNVKCWWNKRFDYYAPCQLQDDVAAVPSEIVLN